MAIAGSSPRKKYKIVMKDGSEHTIRLGTSSAQALSEGMVKPDHVFTGYNLERQIEFCTVMSEVGYFYMIKDQD